MQCEIAIREYSPREQRSSYGSPLKDQQVFETLSTVQRAYAVNYNVHVSKYKKYLRHVWVKCVHNDLNCKTDARIVTTGKADPEGEANCHSQRQKGAPQF